MKTICKTAVWGVMLGALFCGTSPAMKTKAISEKFSVQPGQRIDIRGFSGSRVQFTSWDKPEVSISLTVSMSASDETYEQKFIEGVQVRGSSTPEILSITFDDGSTTIQGSKSFWEGLKSLFGGVRSVSREVTGEIRVPASNDLNANIPYATVSLQNMKGRVNFKGTSNELELRNCSSLQEVSNDYGKTSVRGSGGSLVLRSQSGTIEIEDFNGPVTCDADYSKMRLARIGGTVSVTSQSGELTAGDVKGNLTVRADYSPITVSGVAGFADITSQSGTVRVHNVEGVKVDADYSKIEVTGVSGKSGREIVVASQSGSLVMEDVVGNVRIDNPYSRMTLKNVKGNVHLSSQSGTITGDDITGDWDSETEYSTIRLKGLSAREVRITNSSNPVSLDLTVVPSHVTIRTQYAGVTLAMPKGFTGDVNLDAEYGSIETNLPLNAKNRSGSAYAIGKLGVGTGSMTVETTSGNIEVKEK